MPAFEDEYFVTVQWAFEGGARLIIEKDKCYGSFKVTYIANTKTRTYNPQVVNVSEDAALGLATILQNREMSVPDKLPLVERFITRTQAEQSGHPPQPMMAEEMLRRQKNPSGKDMPGF